MLTEYGVEQGYCTASISYDSTSVQRLYKIDDEEWKTYTKEIRLELGQTLYAKGIDKYGKEARIIPSYKSVLPSDALGVAAYDGNTSTGISIVQTSKRINIDNSMIGKKVNITHSNNNWKITINLYSSEKELLKTYSSVSYTSSTQFIIPEDVSYLIIKGPTYTFNIYEVGPIT